MRTSSLMVLSFIATTLLALTTTPTLASNLQDVDSIPHLDAGGKEAYRAFLTAKGHRAFAIAPGGMWSWKGDETSAGAASEEALQSCQFESEQQCVLYAVDDRVVFDKQHWASLWGPYVSRTEASSKATGAERGKRFYDIKFKDASGKGLKLSELRGKVVIVHFWGSWCPPCQRELPELQRLYQALDKSPDIKMVLLQVREDFNTSKHAVKRHRLKLPLYDSGAQAKSDDKLQLAGGGTLKDRDIAAVFPTTYVLDKHGIVLFSHVGPVSDWMGYLPLLKDAAIRSGR
ncbi:MAG: TlpA disulfide reductase family protein [Sideroxydans sp.]